MNTRYRLSLTFSLVIEKRLNQYEESLFMVNFESYIPHRSIDRILALADKKCF